MGASKPEPGNVRVKLRIDVPGLFHSRYEDLKRGDIVEIDEDNANRYCRIGIAQADLDGPLGPPYHGSPIRRN